MTASSPRDVGGRPEARCEREDCRAVVRRFKAQPAYPRFHTLYEMVCAFGHKQLGAAR